MRSDGYYEYYKALEDFRNVWRHYEIENEKSDEEVVNISLSDGRVMSLVVDHSAVE